MIVVSPPMLFVDIGIRMLRDVLDTIPTMMMTMMKLVTRRREAMPRRHMPFGHDHGMIVAMTWVYGRGLRTMIRIVMMCCSMNF